MGGRSQGPQPTFQVLALQTNALKRQVLQFCPGTHKGALGHGL